MLAIVWVVQTGSITRTSACITARSTFSCADAVSGSSSAARTARTRTIIAIPTNRGALPMRLRCGYALENEAPGFRILVEWPDRTLDLGVGDLRRIALQWAVGIDVDHLLRDRAVGGHEVVGRLHLHGLLLGRLDADVAEQLEPGRLRSVGDQHDVDAAHPHRGTVADRHL